MGSSSSKKRKRSFTGEDDEDEEARSRFEFDLNKEPEPDEESYPRFEIDLNKEPELAEEYDRHRAELNKEADTHDDDAKHEEEEEEEAEDKNVIVASELAVSEAEKKKTEDANPINREITARATARRLTPEEEKDIYLRDADAIAKLVVRDTKSLSNTTQAENQRNTSKKRRKESKDEDEEDDSEQTLALLSRWEPPSRPPGKIINRSLIKNFSRPIRKQLTVSDVSGGAGDHQSRLALSKHQVRKKFLQILQESEIPGGKRGAMVSVYGPDGNVRKMKMFPDGKKPADLSTGWRKFVGDYKLKEFSDFVTIWMFRHRRTQQICLAIDTKRLSLKKQVSKRISKAAFEDSD